jgi:hypothetical protein
MALPTPANKDVSVNGNAALHYTKTSKGFTIQLSGKDLFTALKADGFVPSSLADHMDKFVIEVAVTW